MQLELSKQDLESHLREQIEFLKRSTKSYDEGFESEGKRIAVVLRVLLHDTNQSLSLLNQLRFKNILFHDTAFDYIPDNLMPSYCLVITKVTQSEWGYTPPLDNGPPHMYKHGKVPFDTWWNKIVIVDPEKNMFTRKDLILTMSNKDGGAHVDPKISKAYKHITMLGSMGWKFVVDGTELKLSTKIELASVRQIAHEVLKSLKDELLEYF